MKLYRVSKGMRKSIDSYGILLQNNIMARLEDLFVFQKICILHKDSFTQYSGKVKSWF